MHIAWQTCRLEMPIGGTAQATPSALRGRRALVAVLPMHTLAKTWVLRASHSKTLLTRRLGEVGIDAALPFSTVVQA